MKLINLNSLHVTNHFHMFVTHTNCRPVRTILTDFVHKWTALNWKIHCCDKEKYVIVFIIQFSIETNGLHVHNRY